MSHAPLSAIQTSVAAALACICGYVAIYYAFYAPAPAGHYLVQTLMDYAASPHTYQYCSVHGALNCDDKDACTTKCLVYNTYVCYDVYALYQPASANVTCSDLVVDSNTNVNCFRTDVAAIQYASKIRPRGTVGRWFVDQQGICSSCQSTSWEGIYHALLITTLVLACALLVGVVAYNRRQPTLPGYEYNNT